MKLIISNILSDVIMVIFMICGAVILVYNFLLFCPSISYEYHFSNLLGTIQLVDVNRLYLRLQNVVIESIL